MGKTMKVMTLANHKGGVRKTTLAVTTADAFARDGYRVLLVDLDPQAHATVLAYSLDEAPATPIEKVMSGEKTLGEAIIQHSAIDGVHVLGSTLRLGNLERELMQKPFSSITLVRDMLKLVSSIYDIVIIDTAPSLSFLTANALAASDFVFVPIESGSKLSVIGTEDMRDFIRQAQRVNPGLKFGGAILTMHDARKTLCQITATSVNQIYETVLKETLPPAEAMRQAQSIGKTILQFKREDAASRKMVALAREMADIIGLSSSPKVAKEAENV